MAQLLLLEADDPERDIALYVNSPGGSAYAGMAIYDAMQHVRPDVSTICFGMGMSAAAMIMAGGAAGKRFALPNAKLMIHQGSAGFRGAPSDIQIAAREVAATTRQMAEIIGRHSGRDIETVMEDIDRDRFMTPRRGGRVRPHRRHPAAARPGRRAVASPAWTPAASITSASPFPISTRPSRRTRASSGPRLEHREIVSEQGVEAASVLVGGSRIELLAPTGEDTPVGRFLAGAAPAFTTSPTRSTTSGSRWTALAADGVELIDTVPRVGLFGLQVAFIHPDAVHGVLTEVVSVARAI